MARQTKKDIIRFLFNSAIEVTVLIIRETISINRIMLFEYIHLNRQKHYLGKNH